MDRGGWWATADGVAESDTIEQITHTHTHTHTNSFLGEYIERRKTVQEYFMLKYTQIIKYL